MKLFFIIREDSYFFQDQVILIVYFNSPMHQINSYMNRDYGSGFLIQ